MSEHKKDQVYTLTDFVDFNVWVAWKTETRNGKKTKVPYRSTTKHAQSNNPATWLDFDTASDIALTDKFKAHGGIGIMMGVPMTGELQLGGIDLDTCIQDGIIAPWAQEI